MAKAAIAYSDNQGKLYPSPEQAVLADLTLILGRIGAESGITSGLAQRIIEKRTEIEAVFADLDRMTVRGGIPDGMKLEFNFAGDT